MADPEFHSITLPDGRHLAYTQLGCTHQTCQRPLLALHGMMACRLTAMPGVSEDTLREFGVRLVSVDRPGYGRSDPHKSETLQSFCKDIEVLIDALNLGKKIWLLGFSMGGAFCWAAARYIPDRIAGIALWSPVGDLWWKGISKNERKAMLANFSPSDRRFASVSRRMPFFFYRRYGKRLSSRLVRGRTTALQINLSPRDLECMQRAGVAEFASRGFIESTTHTKGYGFAKDLQLMTKRWGFQIAEIGKVFKGHIHIWQGDQDVLIPLTLQQWIQKQLPEVVHLHELPGEGHLSWVWFNDLAHRETMTTLFTEEEQKQQTA